MSWIFPLWFSSFIFWKGFSLIIKFSQASQPATCFLLSPGHRCMLPSWPFTLVLEDAGPHACLSGTLPIEPSPQPHRSLFSSEQCYHKHLSPCLTHLTSCPLWKIQSFILVNKINRTQWYESTDGHPHSGLFKRLGVEVLECVNPGPFLRVGKLHCGSTQEKTLDQVHRNNGRNRRVLSRRGSGGSGAGGREVRSRTGIHQSPWIVGMSFHGSKQSSNVKSFLMELHERNQLV